MFNEEKIVIPYEEYKSLVAKAERIEVVERILNSTEYISIGEIVAVLGIEVPPRKVIE